MLSTRDSGVSYNNAPKKLDLDLKSRVTPPAKPFIKEMLVFKLKDLPSHYYYYVFLEIIIPC